MTTNNCTSKKSTTVLIWGAFLIFFALVFVYKIDSGGLYSPQEPRSALVAGNMITSGDMLTMHINGDETLQKPVFAYWLTVATMKIFGHNELGVRFPSTIAAFITLLTTFFLGRALYGRTVGYLAMFTLGSMLSFVHLSRLARIDIILTALFSVAMLLFYKAYVEKNRCTWYIFPFYFVLGISVLTKGPVTVALAGMIIMAYCAKKKDWSILWKVRPISGAIIGLAICMPWFIYENERTGGEFFKAFFLGHNVERFTGSTGEFGKKKPIWFYIPQLFAGAMPWGLLFPVILYSFREKLKNIFLGPVRFFTTKFGGETTESDDVAFSDKTNYLCFWVTIILVFFSLSAFKRKDYLLPLYPPLAVLLARYIVSIAVVNAASLRKGVTATVGFLSTLFSLVLIATFLGFPQQWADKVLTTQEKVFHLNTKDAFMVRSIADIITGNVTISLLAILAIVLMVWWCGRMFIKGYNIRGAYCGVALAAGLFTVNELIFEPFKDARLSTKDFALVSRDHIEDGKKVVFYIAWNLEAAFFLNHEYERYSSLREMTSSHEQQGVCKYFIFRKDWFYNLNEITRAQFEVVESMSDKQRRPLIFCQVKDGVSLSGI